MTDFILIGILTLVVIGYFLWSYRQESTQAKKYFTDTEWLDLGKAKGKLVLVLLLVVWFLGEFKPVSSWHSGVLSWAIYFVIFIVIENIIQRSKK
jgi:nicotinamide riboside transporter PnuC